MFLKQMYDGQFIWHKGIAKTARLKREAPKYQVFVEWNDPVTGDFVYGYGFPSEMSPYDIKL
jgi:hypothetical protein